MTPMEELLQTNATAWQRRNEDLFDAPTPELIDHAVHSPASAQSVRLPSSGISSMVLMIAVAALSYIISSYTALPYHIVHGPIRNVPTSSSDTSGTKQPAPVDSNHTTRSIVVSRNERDAVTASLGTHLADHEMIIDNQFSARPQSTYTADYMRLLKTAEDMENSNTLSSISMYRSLAQLSISNRNYANAKVAIDKAYSLAHVVGNHDLVKAITDERSLIIQSIEALDSLSVH